MPEVVDFFVYGTLRPGQARWRILEPFAVKIEAATMSGLSMFTTGAFPFIQNIAGMDLKPVRGEIITVPEDVLQLVFATLDVYEGYDPDDHEGSLYLRTRLIARKIRDNTVVSCWTYVAGHALKQGVREKRYPMIPSGDWTHQ